MDTNIQRNAATKQPNVLTNAVLQSVILLSVMAPPLKYYLIKSSAFLGSISLDRFKSKE